MIETYALDSSNRPTISKDPSDILDYTADFTDMMAAISANIATYSVTATGGTVVSTSKSGEMLTVFTSGGVIGGTIELHFQVTPTGLNRVINRTIVLKIVAR